MQQRMCDGIRYHRKGKVGTKKMQLKICDLEKKNEKT